jgi:hypothetical protein
MDGGKQECSGIYHLNQDQLMSVVLHCPGEEVMTEEVSLKGLSPGNLSIGFIRKMTFKTSLNPSEASSVVVLMKKIK